jgi:serine phosphatase RsbU (regulator of sigma subunit)
VARPDGLIEILAPTAPLIGVFDDQHHLFQQDVVILSAGAVFVASTDGITEARNEEGEIFGMDRLIELVKANRQEDVRTIADRILDAAQAFGSDRIHDDMAIVAARFA